jgi:CubicO group peptidase (beta-lactamase class C family)
VTPWLVLALVLLVRGPALAQAPGDEAAGLRVDDAVRTAKAERSFPSAVVAVVRDGAIVKAAAYGQMRLRDAEPATPQTVYRLDSVTKQFTAAGIMLLVQDGRVDLRPDLTWTVRRPMLLSEGLEPSADERKDAP